jgi:hypothetical protein
MLLSKSLTGIPGQNVTRLESVCGLLPGHRRPQRIFPERLETRLYQSTGNAGIIGSSLLIEILVGVMMTACLPSAYADLYVISQVSSSVLRYNEVTGAFLDTFISAHSGGLSTPRGLLFGRDGNLYITSNDTHSVMRYDGKTGAPLPAPGQTGANFVPPRSGGLQNPAQFIFGPDGNLYVDSQTNNAVLRYDGTTGVFIDVFIPTGRGGLDSPRGLVFGPDGNLYIKCPSSVLRYDGTTGASLPAPGRSGAVFASGLGEDGPPLVFGPDGNLYVGDFVKSQILRLSGTTGQILDTFVSPSSGGLNGPGPLMLFGPDNNLYVCSENNNRVLRYDGMTGAPLPAPGQTGATFIYPKESGPFTPHGQCFSNTDPTTLVYVHAPAKSLVMTAPATVIAGTPFDITITALDPYGNIAPGYSGTVTFTSSDPQAMLPPDYTFTSADNGVHTFSGVTLVAAGAQTLTAQDTADGSLTASVTIGATAAPADHFVITAPSSIIAGVSFDLTITAQDPYGNLATGYSGTVTFTSSDAQATLPADYTFTAADNGMHPFSGIILRTAGAQTATAQDTASVSLTGNAAVTVVAAPADHFQITAPATAVSGTPFDVTITARDPYGNVDTNYAGTTAWTSSDTDPGVILPADYTFQVTDQGTHTFSAGVTLITPGNQILTATDAVSGITGSATVTVTSSPRPPSGGGARNPRIPNITARLVVTRIAG